MVQQAPITPLGYSGLPILEVSPPSRPLTPCSVRTTNSASTKTETGESKLHNGQSPDNSKSSGNSNGKKKGIRNIVLRRWSTHSTGHVDTTMLSPTCGTQSDYDSSGDERSVRSAYTAGSSVTTLAGTPSEIGEFCESPTEEHGPSIFFPQQNRAQDNEKDVQYNTTYDDEKEEADAAAMEMENMPKGANCARKTLYHVYHSGSMQESYAFHRVPDSVVAASLRAASATTSDSTVKRMQTIDVQKCRMEGWFKGQKKRQWLPTWEETELDWRVPEYFLHTPRISGHLPAATLRWGGLYQSQDSTNGDCDPADGDMAGENKEEGIEDEGTGTEKIGNGFVDSGYLLQPYRKRKRLRKRDMKYAPIVCHICGNFFWRKYLLEFMMLHPPPGFHNLASITSRMPEPSPVLFSTAQSKWEKRDKTGWVYRNLNEPGVFDGRGVLGEKYPFKKGKCGWRQRGETGKEWVEREKDRMKKEKEMLVINGGAGTRGELRRRSTIDVATLHTAMRESEAKDSAVQPTSLEVLVPPEQLPRHLLPAYIPPPHLPSPYENISPSSTLSSSLPPHHPSTLTLNWSRIMKTREYTFTYLGYEFHWKGTKKLEEYIRPKSPNNTTQDGKNKEREDANPNEEHTADKQKKKGIDLCLWAHLKLVVEIPIEQDGDEYNGYDKEMPVGEDEGPELHGIKRTFSFSSLFSQKGIRRRSTSDTTISRASTIVQPTAPSDGNGKSYNTFPRPKTGDSPTPSPPPPSQSAPPSNSPSSSSNRAQTWSSTASTLLSVPSHHNANRPPIPWNEKGGHGHTRSFSGSSTFSTSTSSLYPPSRPSSSTSSFPGFRSPFSPSASSTALLPQRKNTSSSSLSTPGKRQLVVAQFTCLPTQRRKSGRLTIHEDMLEYLAGKIYKPTEVRIAKPYAPAGGTNLSMKPTNIGDDIPNPTAPSTSQSPPLTANPSEEKKGDINTNNNTSTTTSPPPYTPTDTNAKSTPKPAEQEEMEEGDDEIRIARLRHVVVSTASCMIVSEKEKRETLKEIAYTIIGAAGEGGGG